MKLSQRIGLKLANIIVLLCCLGIVYSQFESLQAGRLTMSDFILSLVIIFVVYKIYKSSFVQTLMCRFFGWDPAGVVLDEMRERNRRDYAAWVQKRNKQIKEENKRAAARRQAENAAIFHENQAKRYAGTNDGYCHANMAKKYRNDAKR